MSAPKINPNYPPSWELRDFFAAFVIAKTWGMSGLGKESSMEALARDAYKMADAMIKIRLEASL